MELERSNGVINNLVKNTLKKVSFKCVIILIWLLTIQEDLDASLQTYVTILNSVKIIHIL